MCIVWQRGSSRQGRNKVVMKHFFWFYVGANSAISIIKRVGDLMLPPLGFRWNETNSKVMGFVVSSMDSLGNIFGRVKITYGWVSFKSSQPSHLYCASNRWILLVVVVGLDWKFVQVLACQPFIRFSVHNRIRLDEMRINHGGCNTYHTSSYVFC